MTFLYISTDLGVKSSGGLVCSKELQAMKSLGDDVIEIGPKDIGPVENGLVDTPFLIDYLTLYRLSKLDLKGLKVDLVHMYGGCYGQTIRFLKNKGIKTSTSIMFHNRKISIEEHEKYYGQYPFNHVKDDRLWSLYIEGIREADVVIVAGTTPRDLVLNEGCKRVEIVPLGCNIPENGKIKEFPKEFRVGYLGAIGPDKGLIYLIKAWEKLNYTDSTLLFAGPFKDNLTKVINAYASRGRFHLMGYVNDVSELYNNISIYVQPSATEGFGIEVPEAMSYGRPIICSNGAGAADCITDREDGFVIPAMNIDAIADRIQYFKDNLSELGRMGYNAREKARNYTWDKTIERYTNLWREML
jgi:glycosyltransferase involved in cell wall biosynthesis